MSSYPIKLAFVCSTLNQLGGPASHIRNLYKYFNGNEFRVTLILCSQNEDALKNYMIDGGVDMESMIFIPHVQKRAIFPFIFTLRNIFHSKGFDIVHAFETQTQVLAGWAAYWAGVKIFIGHCEAQFLPSTISFPKRVFFRGLNFWLKDYFTKTIAVSSALKEELVKKRLRPAEKVQLIHLGIVVNDGVNNNYSYSGLAAGAPIIGVLSRLSVEKGLDRFIQAVPLILQRIPQARFVIYGEGKEKESLQSLANKLSVLERIEFKPWAQDVREALSGIEIFVMPSHREGLPITLLEAMSLGRLCVASDIEGIQDVINNGVEGLLVDTRNIPSLAQAIILLCYDNNTRAAVMGRAAVERVRGYFNVEREACEIKELYKELLAC